MAVPGFAEANRQRTLLVKFERLVAGPRISYTSPAPAAISSLLINIGALGSMAARRAVHRG